MKITKELLKEWDACADGFKVFVEMFPQGAKLSKAMKGLDKAGHGFGSSHDDWSFWLFDKCRVNGLFKSTVALGYRNSGNVNSGDRNSGNRNSGSRNSGYRNSGNWNSGSRNSGFFNITTPDEILVFGEPCSRSVWEKYEKPAFLYFDLNYWVDESKMTDEEKAADPNFYVRGGQLKTKSYKEAFKESWESADKQDRERIRECPNFNAEMFYKISGIDLR